jgi:hypothetical protein
MKTEEKQMSENIKRKLASRKLWSMILGLVGSVLVAMNFNENQITQIVGIIGGFASIIIYMLSESATDVAALTANQTLQTTTSETNVTQTTTSETNVTKTTNTELSKDLNIEHDQKKAENS